MTLLRNPVITFDDIANSWGERFQRNCIVFIQARSCENFISNDADTIPEGSNLISSIRKMKLAMKSFLHRRIGLCPLPPLCLDIHCRCRQSVCLEPLIMGIHPKERRSPAQITWVNCRDSRDQINGTNGSRSTCSTKSHAHGTGPKLDLKRNDKCFCDVFKSSAETLKKGFILHVYFLVTLAKDIQKRKSFVSCRAKPLRPMKTFWEIKRRTSGGVLTNTWTLGRRSTIVILIYKFNHVKWKKFLEYELQKLFKFIQCKKRGLFFPLSNTQSFQLKLGNALKKRLFYALDKKTPLSEMKLFRFGPFENL